MVTTVTFSPELTAKINKLQGLLMYTSGKAVTKVDSIDYAVSSILKAEENSNAV